MSKYISRQTIIDELKVLNVEFDEKATVPELRKIYDRVRGKLNTDEGDFLIEISDAAEKTKITEVKNNDATAVPHSLGISADLIKTVVDAILKMHSDALKNKEAETAADVNSATGSEPYFDTDAGGDLRRAEIERLKLQIDELQKRNDFLTMNEGFNRLDLRRFDFFAFEAMVHRFNGDDSYDVRKWLEDLDDAFSMFECTPSEKLIASRRLLDGTAKLLLRTISVRTYDELKTELLREFGKVFTMQEVFHQLKARTLKPSESVKRYMIEMQEIAMRAKIPEPDLIDIIIDGLNDKSQHVSMLYSAKNMSELKVLLERYEKKRFSDDCVEYEFLDDEFDLNN